MNKPIVAAALFVVVTSACPDPVGDKPRATVSEPTPATATPSSAPTAATPAAPTAGVTRYMIDESASKVGFVGAKVTGKHDGGFKKFKGTIDVAGEDVTTAKIDVEIDMKSIWADNPKLEGHLKSADFFDVEKIPTARFVSKSVTKGPDGVTVSGDLTLHGVTKQISFPAKVTVSKESATAQSEFGLNRKDFGITYPGKPDDLIKDEVLLKLDINGKAAAG